MQTENINLIRQVVEREVKVLISKMIDEYDNSKIRASGEWAESLRYEFKGTSVVIYGTDYTRFAKFGRKEGKLPPIRELKKWVELKIKVSDPQSLGIAFAIAKKIENEGSKRYRENNPSDFLEKAFSESNLKQLSKSISIAYSTKIKQELMKKINNVHAAIK